MAKKVFEQEKRFRMTDFKRDAEKITSWSALARNYAMTVPMAQKTCTIHGITPPHLSSARHENNRTAPSSY
jgi:hypothetical protein